MKHIEKYYTAKLAEDLQATDKQVQQLLIIGRWVENPAHLWRDEKTYRDCMLKAVENRLPKNPEVQRYDIESQALMLLSHILEGHGIESVKVGGITYDYVNFGDIYAATIMIERGTGLLCVSSYGDLLEANKTNEV